MLQIHYIEQFDGPGPGQKVVTLKTSTGRVEEVIVHENHIVNGSLLVAGVAQRDNEMLIELPAESSSGNWRIWVDQSALGL